MPDSTFNVEVVGDDALVLFLENMPDVIRRAMRTALDGLTTDLKQAAQRRAPQRSGRLRQSIDAEVFEASDYTMGIMVTSLGVPYANLIEHGGTIPPHLIVPKVAAVMAFLAYGQVNFARQVMHPGAAFTGVHFIEQAIDENVGFISAALEAALQDATDTAIAGAT